ncbi:MAG: SPASM domain-containing protein, partial [Planctomycetes bacterium]|nr:SPASM domain-containing protein [Planctomycetota bacterium]
TYAAMIGISYRLDCNITHREDNDASGIGMRLEDHEANAYYQRLWADWLQNNPHIEVSGQSLAKDLDIIETTHLCAAGHTYCYIDSVGTVHPCPSYQRPIGSIREQSFAEIWQDSNFLARLRAMTHGKLKGCEGCGDKGFCTFCPGDARNEGIDRDEGFGQYDRGCHNAKLNREAFESVVLAKP